MHQNFNTLGGLQHPMFTQMTEPMTDVQVTQCLNDMLKMTPMTPLGAAAVASALGLLEQLKRQVTQVKDDPYWKLREFGDRALQVIPVDEEADRQRRVLFYDRPRGIVYLGYSADLENEIPPVVYKATMDAGYSVPSLMSLDGVITAVKDACEIMQVSIFGRPLEEEKEPYQGPELPVKDWEIIIDLSSNYYEVDFRKAFEDQLENHKPLVHGSPAHQYHEFSRKYNLGYIFGNPRRGSENIRVWSVGGTQHWEWIMSK